MYHSPDAPKDYKKPNKGLRREAFRSHFLLFVIDTVMMCGLIACGVAGVVFMDGEKFSTPPFFVASFLSAYVLMAKATVGGCFSIQGLFVKDKPEDPETALVIIHMVLSVVALVGYFVSIIVFGVSRVLGPCAGSNDTPGCSHKEGIYKALGSVTLVIILISVFLTGFGIYLFWRFGKEFGVSPYKKSKKRPEQPRSISKSLSIHNEITDDDDTKDFI